MQSSANLSPSINHLRFDSIVRSWSDSPEIEWTAAITLAEMSKLAYDDAPTRQRKLTELGFDDRHLLDSGPTSGFVAMTDDVAVVAFRGTDDVADWIGNLDFRQLAELGSARTLHSGFLAAYGLFAAQVQAQLGSRNPKHVWITGHSLGAAMAACCAYDLLQKSVPFAGVVTFGQPRVGNEALANYLDAELGDRYLRLMNEGDPVPILPPCFGVKLPAYWHSGRRAWFLWGKLFTIEGPTPYAAPAPGSEKVAPAPGVLEQPAGKDKFPSMTDDDFLELQRQLQAMHEVSAGPVASATAAETAVGQPVSEAQGFVDSVVRFFLARIGEHKMDEYLRQLNEFRRKTLRDGK